MKKRANADPGLAIIAGVLSSVVAVSAQDNTPTPQPAGQSVATAVEVIVTGSNIPTAEEVGPQPVDTYRRDDIFHLGVRSATDFVQKLPVVTGPSISDNINVFGDGRTEVDLRGLGPKETLVLQDGRRIATDGFAGFDVGRNFPFTPTVDLNVFPLGLIDHIDILKDGASAIYGSDAVGGVVNVFLIHRFRGVEIYSSYGNTNLGASNDQAEELAYILAGTGNDKTDIVVYAEFALYAQWDGTAFSGVFVDRRPALTGGSALMYSIPVSISGSRITITVPAALAAQVRAAVVLPGATWNCDTGWDNTALFGIGTEAIHIADVIGRHPCPSDLLGLLDRGLNQHSKH